MLKVIMVLSALFMSSAALSKNYYRFWRGNIANGMTENDFKQGLNKIFIPETVKQGLGHGLVSYLPVLIHRTNTKKIFPDEIALVAYESEEVYRNIRMMPNGTIYERLHWDYFEKSKSKSLVPEIYQDRVDVEKAYDLLGSNTNWQNGKVQFLVRKWKVDFNDEVKKEIKDYFKMIKSKAKNIGIKSHLVLISKIGMYEYILYDKSNHPIAMNRISLDHLDTFMNIVLKNNNLPIDFGEGVNRQFFFDR